jgi:membrane protease YdiL (CAAX protease family)
VTAPAFWSRFALATALSLILIATLAPPRPELRIPALTGVVAGVVAGALLYATVAKRRPALPLQLPGTLARCFVLGLAAANEEVLWRRVILGELLHSGAAAALAGSTLGFALAHRARPGLHLGTGFVFGGLYLATGALGACIAAHLTYNLCLLALRDQVEPRGELVR